jgi:hypothetical protein
MTCGTDSDDDRGRVGRSVSLAHPPTNTTQKRKTGRDGMGSWG